TPPDQWAYAARLPLTQSGWNRGVILRIQVLVTEGQVGFGVLRSNGKAFIVEEIVNPTSDFIDVDLLLSESTRVSDLIVRNTAPGNVCSKVTVRNVDLWEVQ